MVSDRECFTMTMVKIDVILTCRFFFSFLKSLERFSLNLKLVSIHEDLNEFSPSHFYGILLLIT